MPLLTTAFAVIPLSSNTGQNPEHKNIKT